jgi:cation:H+ antiporter
VASFGLLVVLGLVSLVAGAELLVRGASRAASALGISPLVIGLTVVAFGTSSPELAASVRAGLAGASDLSVGNVVGSNVFNVLVILGLAAVLTPIAVDRQLLRLDVPFMVASSFLVWGLAADGRLSRVEGTVLLSGIVGYTALLIRLSRREPTALEAEYAAEIAAPRGPRPRTLALGALAALGGLVMLVAGAGWLVDGATGVARLLGVDELVIGLTVVAAGTSLPELATSAVAAVRGHRDIAVGNVVGSNIFNLLSVLGVTAVVSPGGIAFSDRALGRDLPVMVVVALACLPVFFTGLVVSRWEGGLLLAGYAAYAGWLVVRARGGDADPAVRTSLIVMVVAVVAVTLVVGIARALRRRRLAGRG